MQSQEKWKQNKSFLAILPRTMIKCSLVPYYQKVLEAGGTIFLAKNPFWTFFGSKKEPYRNLTYLLVTKKGSKHCKQGSLAKKMVPQASRTFWEHGARPGEHLMGWWFLVK